MNKELQALIEDWAFEVKPNSKNLDDNIYRNGLVRGATFMHSLYGVSPEEVERMKIVLDGIRKELDLYGHVGSKIDTMNKITEALNFKK